MITLTDEEFVHLFNALWAQGYAVVEGMPMVEDVVRSSHHDACDVVLAVSGRIKDFGDIVARVNQLDLDRSA